jgi:MoxR-like ATPase
LTEYKGDATDFYLAPKPVAEVVNLAIRLGRPLLVEGEPGCGKTTLASSIAAELDLGEVVLISVKSTSRAQDLLYRLNALRRLQDAQDPHNQTARFVYPYITMEPLGDAIRSGKRRVVLIDEVDKADIDFPNDLLDVLDRFRFEIDDLPLKESELCQNERGFGRVVQGSPGEQPIVVITSNREKRLPEPFLRRCLYVRLLFPTDVETLREIVLRNTRKTGDQIGQELLDAAIQAFQSVRGAAIERRFQKPPTTGELIDWIRILYWNGARPEDLRSNPRVPPRWELLFKTMDDLNEYAGIAAEAGRA